MFNFFSDYCRWFLVFVWGVIPLVLSFIIIFFSLKKRKMDKSGVFAPMFFVWSCFFFFGLMGVQFSDRWTALITGSLLVGELWFGIFSLSS